MRNAVIALALSLGVAAFAPAPVSAATLVAEDFGGANDCSGLWGTGFENCKTPDRPGYASSPVIAKYDVGRDGGKWQIASWAGPILSSYFTITLNGNGSTGSWSYDTSACPTCALVTSFVVKAGNGFRWYYTNPKTAIYSGTWSTKGGKGLSHITFYDTAPPPPPPPPAPIPLPASGLLLGFALAAFGLARRRAA